MKVYEITIEWYNHISGSGYTVVEKKFTDLNTAKREMIKLAMEDDNLMEDDGVCHITANMMSIHCEGGRDYSDYYILESNIQISKKKSSEITIEELKEIIEEQKEYNENLDISILGEGK